ncbi:MAG: AAA family ATPase [Holophagales bacterium]|jgi:predicted ATPase|nr:AAA family ATPase [Holophagales bacterium]
MIITNIRLKNWKNFGEVNADCGKRVFLIGPNASGKSNFLDVLRFLRDVAQDGIKKAVAARGGMKAVRYLCARQQTDVGIFVRLDDTWEYELSFNSDSKGAPKIKKEHVVLLKNGERDKLLQRPDKDDRQDEMRLTQTALEQVNANKKFREIADFFSSIQYRHILPQIVRDPKNFSPQPIKSDPFGRDLVSQIWNTPAKIRDARLKKINEALSIAVPQLNNLAVEQDKATGLPHLKVNYAHWRTHGAYQNEASFSDGTLRLLALLWSIFDAQGPLLLEEPELSLHVGIVSQLPDIFANLDKDRKKAVRQIFITTHSEAMLNIPGIGANEVLRLEADAEGTKIHTADALDAKAMEDGLTAADVLLPKTRYNGIEKLSQFSLKALP